MPINRPWLSASCDSNSTLFFLIRGLLKIFLLHFIELLFVVLSLVFANEASHLRALLFRPFEKWGGTLYSDVF